LTVICEQNNVNKPIGSRSSILTNGLDFVCSVQRFGSSTHICPPPLFLPVIVFFHGGGWLQGDKADGVARLMPFVRSSEYAGVSVGYRLSGEATWPAQIYDCKAAIRWIRAHADKYDLDPERIAGSHLALMLGVSCDLPELEGDVGPHGDMTSEVSGVVNFFGVTEILAIIGQPSDIDRTSLQAPEAMLIGGALLNNTEKARAASPITYVTPNDPPVLTIHSTADLTVPYDQAN
jgi:acetyl esterase/lipase